MTHSTFLKPLILAFVALSVLATGCSKDPEPGAKAQAEKESKEATETKAKKTRASKKKVGPEDEDKSSKKERQAEALHKKEALNKKKAPGKSEAKPASPTVAENKEKKIKAENGPETKKPATEKQTPVQGNKETKRAVAVEIAPDLNAANQDRPGPLRAQASAAPAPLNIDALIVQKDLKKALGISKGFVTLPLTGQEPSPTYNHRRLVPRGAGPVLGLSIQVWRDHTIADARRKYSGFLKSYPGASENRSVTNRTFFARSRYDENLYLGYFALRERTNVVLTCNASVCNAETLHKVALATKKRLPSFIKN